MDKIIAWVVTLFTAIIGFMFGNDVTHYQLIYVLIFAMFSDMLFGSINAANKNEFKWNYFRIGITKKVGELFVIALIYQVDKIGLVQGSDFEHFVIGAFIGYELISALNKIEVTGVPIPKFIFDKIKVIFKIFGSDKIEQ